MIRELDFSAGNYHVWPAFRITLPQPISLEYGKVYHLTGNNGSGKSSFIKKIVIPRLLSNRNWQYVLWLEQQMKRQLYALKASAAIASYPHPIVDEESAVRYLLYDLEQSLKVQKRPIVAIADESSMLMELWDFLNFSNQDYCLIFCEHKEPCSIDPDHRLLFDPISTSETEIYETHH